MCFSDDDGGERSGDDVVEDLCGAAEPSPLRVVHQWIVLISPRGAKEATKYYTTAADPDDAIHSLLHRCYFPEVGDVVRRVVRVRSNCNEVRS